MAKEPTKPMSIRLTLEQHRAIRLIALAENKSMGDVLREAFEAAYPNLTRKESA